MNDTKNNVTQNNQAKDYIKGCPLLRKDAEALLLHIRKYVKDARGLNQKLVESKNSIIAKNIPDAIKEPVIKESVAEQPKQQEDKGPVDVKVESKVDEIRKTREDKPKFEKTKPQFNKQDQNGRYKQDYLNRSNGLTQNQSGKFGDKKREGQFSNGNYQRDRQNASNPNIRTRHFDGEQKPGERNQNGYQRFGRMGDQTHQQRPSQRPNGTQSAQRTMLPKADSMVVQQKTTNRNSVNKKKSEYDEKKTMNRKALMMKGFIVDESLENEDGVSMGSRKIKGKKSKQEETVLAPQITHAVITTENLTVKMLAEKIGKPVVEIIKKFMILGNMVSINSTIDFDSAELIAGEFGVTLEKKIEKTYEEKLVDIKEEIDDEKDLVARPPIVTVLGHVDHGKTSLLDYIRNTHVIAGEAGGITQHIGAYTINYNEKMITFIDTPGHAAFTAMRERGAKLTDIAILVVAADDGVMPQTIEAINQIKQVNVPMIVAINKIDKPEANIDRIKQQLTEHGVVPEEWGGDAIIMPISAKTGQNIDKLIDMVLFVAEYQNLTANPKRRAVGSVVEARLDKGMGPVATILVQNGTLKVGDFIVVGTSAGKVRAMFNEKGKNVKSAGPSYAVAVLGLNATPNAGDEMYAVDEKMSKKVITERLIKEQTEKIKDTDTSVDSLLSRMKETEYKSYNVIIKGDVQGSVEALKQTIGAIQNEEVKVRCIHGGVGAINENDIMLASASNALILAFNVKADFKAKVLGEKYKVNIQNFKIIYEAVDYVTNAINAMLTPKYKEVITGHAEIRVIFKASKVGAIAGSYITDGKLIRGQKIRILRKDKEIYAGNIATIQREKDEVKEVMSGFECGIVISGYSSFEVGDIIEGITEERIN